MSHARQRIVVFATTLFAVATMAAPARGQDEVAPREPAPARISNRALVAAMPADVTSVMIWRYDAILKLPEDSALRAATVSLLEHPSPGVALPHLVPSEGRSLADEGVLGVAMGGSNFEGPDPPGRMTGSFVQRFAWIYRQPMHDLEARLRRRVEVTIHEDDGVKVFEVATDGLSDLDAFRRSEQTLFFGCAGQIVAATQDRAETFAMIRSLSGADADLPARWRSLSQRVDLDAPMFVLRRYEQENADDPLSPVSPKLPPERRIDMEGCGLSLRRQEPLVLDLHCLTSEHAKAIDFLSQMLHVPSAQWDVKQVEDGFVAGVPFGQMPAKYLYIIAWITFGAYMA